MCQSGHVFNSTMEHWLESLLRLLMSGDANVGHDSTEHVEELSLLCNVWIDHYLSPYHQHELEHSEHAALAISEIVVLSRLGHDIDIWDKILELAQLVSDGHSENNRQLDAMEFLTLIGLRLQAAENRFARYRSRQRDSGRASGELEMSDGQIA